MTFSELPIGTKFTPCFGFKCTMQKVSMQSAVFLSMQGAPATGQIRTKLSANLKISSGNFGRFTIAA